MIHPAAAVTGSPSLENDATIATIVPAKAEAKDPVEYRIEGNVRTASVTYGA